MAAVLSSSTIFREDQTFSPSSRPKKIYFIEDNDKTSVLKKLPATIFTVIVCLVGASSLHIDCFLRVAIGRWMHVNQLIQVFADDLTALFRWSLVLMLWGVSLQF